MCGRYTLVRLNDILEKFPWIEHGPPDLVPRYNIAPTQPLLAIANDHPDRYDHFMWGLVPSWAKDISIGNKMINARAETLAEKPAFRAALKRRRCLVIADGFYEWKTNPGEKRKTPMYIQMKDSKPFAFAGLWETWHSPDGSELRTCTIVTTTPNPLMHDIHDRMPVILPEKEYQNWLDPKEREAADLLPLLKPFDESQMHARAVSTLVNSPRNETPECLNPAQAQTLWG